MRARKGAAGTPGRRAPAHRLQSRWILLRDGYLPRISDPERPLEERSGSLESLVLAKYGFESRLLARPSRAGYRRDRTGGELAYAPPGPVQSGRGLHRARLGSAERPDPQQGDRLRQSGAR